MDVKMSENNFTSENTITFSVGEEEVLRLTTGGFLYKGETIKDAGEAHRVFLAVFSKMKASFE